jgi:hypothetical protein
LAHDRPQYRWRLSPTNAVPQTGHTLSTSGSRRVTTTTRTRPSLTLPASDVCSVNYITSEHLRSAGGVRAPVERGQRSGYAWELAIEVPRQSSDEGDAAAFEAAIAALQGADDAMRRLFGAAEGDLSSRAA